MTNRADERAARQLGERPEDARTTLRREVHEKTRAHHRVERAWRVGRHLEVGPHVAERLGPLVRHRQHGRGEVGADHAESTCGEEARENAGTTRHIEDEPIRSHAGERAGERPLEQAEVQASHPPAVAAPLVAPGIERAVSPARDVVRGRRRGHGARTVTADTDRRKPAHPS